MTATAATCATAGSPCTGSIPATTPRSPSSSSSPTASSAPRSGSRPGRRRMERSPSASSRCGLAMARFLGPDGKPLERYPALTLLSMVAIPGPTRSGRAAQDGPLLASESSAFRIDPVNFRHRPRNRRPGPGHVPRLDPGRELSHRGRRAGLPTAWKRSSAANSSSPPARPSSWATSHRQAPEEELTCDAPVIPRPGIKSPGPGQYLVGCRRGVHLGRAGCRRGGSKRSPSPRRGRGEGWGEGRREPASPLIRPSGTFSPAGRRGRSPRLST